MLIYLIKQTTKPSITKFRQRRTNVITNTHFMDKKSVLVDKKKTNNHKRITKQEKYHEMILLRNDNYNRNKRKIGYFL